MSSPISWFEIPVLDLQRATAFYEATLATTLQAFDDMRVFPHQPGHTSGCLMKHPNGAPSRVGTLVYFSVTADGIEPAFARAIEAGAKPIVPVTDIGVHGHIAVLEDTEGNAFGLHQDRS